MVRILLGSHGHFASGLKTSLDILLGNSDVVTALDAYVDESSVAEKLDEFFASVNDEDQVLMMSDLLGGSVNTEMCKKLTRPNTYLFAGVNLAFVLELAAMAPYNEEGFEKEYLVNTLNNSQNAMQLVQIDEEEPEQEDDFF